MQIFNVGALEFLIILLLAVIILGPRKAVKTAGDVGRWIKELLQSQFWQDLQATSKEIQDIPKKMMDEAEVQRTLEELDRSNAAIQREIGKEKFKQHEDHWVHPHQFPPDSSTGDE
jgi:Sec-independent protein translocase protein TatA